MIQNIHKFIVKLIPTETPDPKAVKLEDVVLLFNRWIQKKAIAGHKLIDVANYSHVLDGPGIALVALEGNFFLENPATGRRFAYQRKGPLEGDFASRVKACVETVRKAGALMESELPIRFDPERLEILFADRLNAPAEEKTFVELEQSLKNIAKDVEVARDARGLVRANVKIG